MSKFKAGDKVKPTKAFVDSFSEVDGATEGLQSEGTVVRVALYTEVRLDSGYTIGQQGGVWYFLSEELEAVA